jgi:type VI secretion system secreted protein VgrG
MAAADNPSSGKDRANRTPGRPARSRRSYSLLWNLLTVLVLLATLGMGALFLVLFTNPYSTLNPFPPPTLPVALSLPSSTPTPEGWLPPTETPTPEPTATATHTASPSPSPTLTQTPTATLELPAVTLSPGPTIRPSATLGGYAFVPQEGSPDAIPYSIYSDVGCNYMGVGGRVLGLDGSPITPGVIVRLAGVLNGRRVSMDTLSGTVTEFGESGFGFQLADEPIS